MITHDSMRALANNWAVNSDVKMRDYWLMAAELAERLDKIIALLEAQHEEKTVGE